MTQSNKPLVVTDSFTGTDQSTGITVQHLTYGVSGTFVGTWEVQAFVSAAWAPIATGTAAGGGSVALSHPMSVRMACTAFTSGTIVVELAGVQRIPSPFNG